jgi:hypothetical protein
MHLKYHALSAVPFVVTGNYAGAVGALFPDLAWLPNELRFRKSGVANWYEWSKSLTSSQLILYRVVHSVLILFLSALACFLLTGEVSSFFLGWLVHLALDLPTHWGVMRPLPLYPFGWKWPFVLKSIKDKNE